MFQKHGKKVLHFLFEQLFASESSSIEILMEETTFKIVDKKRVWVKKEKSHFWKKLLENVELLVFCCRNEKDV